MTNLHRAWHYWLAEPFTWLFYAFFQPQRFSREFETQYPRFRQRVVPMLRLIVPVFLAGYPLALAGRAVLIPLHLVSPDASRLLLSAAYGIVFGIVFGIAVGIAVGITSAIAVGITAGITAGIAGGIAGGIAVG